jgi:hypothetical protein
MSVSAVICLLWGIDGAGAAHLTSLAELLREYQALGLPLPAKDAKLVRYESGGGGIVNGEVQPKTYGLAFQIKTANQTEHPVLLVGTHQWQPRWDPHTREVEPNPGVTKDLVLDPDAELVLAIQCHARGWEKLAQHLLERSLKTTRLPSRNRLVKMAWYFWESHLTAPEIDRAPVGKRLKELIRQDKELDTEPNRALLKSLDLALVPSKAKPGSVKALIDDLVNYGADTGTIGVFEPEDRYWRIATLGFDAVPDLIEHLVWPGRNSCAAPTERMSAEAGSGANRVTPSRWPLPRNGGRRPASWGKNPTYWTMCCPRKIRKVAEGKSAPTH